jgi:hypothetical protein
MHKGFKCLDPSVGQVYISRDGVFDEQVFLFLAFIQMLVLGFEPSYPFFLTLYSIQVLALGTQFCLTIVMLILHLLIICPALALMWMKQKLLEIYLVQIRA